MKIITRYIVDEFLQVYFISITALSGLYIIVNIFESLKNVISFKPSIDSIIMFYATQLPNIIYQVIPMASLLTVVIVYTVMSRNNEISSLLTTGIGPITIVKPSVIIVVLLSIAHFMLGEYIVPAANMKNAILDAEIHHTRMSLSNDLKVNNMWFKSGNNIYRVGLFIPWLKTIKDITVYSFSNENSVLIKRVDINYATWDNGMWKAKDIYIRNFIGEEQVGYDFSDSANITLPFMLSDLMHTGKTPDEMNYRELKSYIKKLKEEGYSYAPYDVDLNSKVSYPLSSLFVILLVIPFSLKKRKTSGIMLAFGVSLAIGFSYWIIMAFSMSLGNSSILSAPVAAWLPNIITFIVSIIVITLTKW
jgi:lipopolysaccharide export system permease protein